MGLAEALGIVADLKSPAEMKYVLEHLEEDGTTGYDTLEVDSRGPDHQDLEIEAVDGYGNLRLKTPGVALTKQFDFRPNTQLAAAELHFNGRLVATAAEFPIVLAQFNKRTWASLEPEV